MQQAENESHDDQEAKIEKVFNAYILIENPKKSNNLGPILRCASAYAVKQVIFVGYEKCSVEGSHGSAKHLDIVAYPTFEQANDYLRKPSAEGGCNVSSIVGILGGKANSFDEQGYFVDEDEHTSLVVIPEKDCRKKESTVKDGKSLSSYPKSFPIHKRTFLNGNHCFLISKNWSGLPNYQAKYCDSFVHVPHEPVSLELGTEAIVNSKLLDVPSSLSIVLHHYTAWAKYDERIFSVNKFEVSTVTKGSTLGSKEQREKTSLRMKKKIQLNDEATDIKNSCWNKSIFDDKTDY